MQGSRMQSEQYLQKFIKWCNTHVQLITWCCKCTMEVNTMKSHFNLLQLILVRILCDRYLKDNSWMCILHQYHNTSGLKAYTAMCRREKTCKYMQPRIYFSMRSDQAAWCLKENTSRSWSDRKVDSMRLDEQKTKLNYSMYQTKFDTKMTKMKLNYTANMIMSVSGTVCHLILY